MLLMALLHFRVLVVAQSILMRLKTFLRQQKGQTFVLLQLDLEQTQLKLKCLFLPMETSVLGRGRQLLRFMFLVIH